MKIVFASDHAGFELKKKLVLFVRGLGFEVEDFGAARYDELDDYPDIISKAATAVSKNPENTKGIILGGSGQGEAIVANRYPHVRAAVYYGGEEEIITLSREHNDANILSLGARFISEAQAKRVVEQWLEAAFQGEQRHKRRIKKIEQITDNL